MADKKFVTIASGGMDTRLVSFDEANIPTSDQKAALAGTSPSGSNKYMTFSDGSMGGGIVGEIRAFQNTIPDNYLELNGAQLSLTTYDTLAEYLSSLVAYDGAFSLVPPGKEFTTHYEEFDSYLTFSSPHGLSDNDRIKVRSTSHLPGGLDALILYFVKYVDAYKIEVSLTASGDAVVLTSNGSGYKYAYTHFTLVDSRDRFPKGFITGDSLGNVQTDQIQQITGTVYTTMHVTATVPVFQIASGVFSLSGNESFGYPSSYSGPVTNTGCLNFNNANSSGARVGTYTRPKSWIVKWAICYSNNV